jgi:hypothetical protein
METRRRQGWLIFRLDTDDKAGPMSVPYYSGKAALIQAVGCIQAELDVQGYEDIYLYALHPEGCKTGLLNHELVQIWDKQLLVAISAELNMVTLYLMYELSQVHEMYLFLPPKSVS